MKNPMILGLVRGRHEMPTNEYLFDTAVSEVFNFAEMQSTFASKLAGVKSLQVYVTGLTVVTVELIKFCTKRRIELDLLHYNAATGEYVTQTVLRQFVDWDSQQIYMEASM